jgi:8-oxo-dGTP pyrophosphatase MutT (NUDIX family)
VNRYSAIAIFDKDLDRVVLIEKQKPAWQAGKANFPGGKVEPSDYRNSSLCSTCSIADSVISCDECVNNTHLACAIRETAEETGLILDPSTVKHFATLRFTTDGQSGECRFFCCIGDVDTATTKEQERIFVDDVFSIMHGQVSYCTDDSNTPRYHFLDTMPNLPWLCAMARQRLRDGYDGADVHVVEERGRVQPLAKSGGHEPNCRWAKALGSVAIECEHGVDVCPKCDPCECEVDK